MDLNSFASQLLERDETNDHGRGIRSWADEAHRVTAWHVLRLAPHHDELDELDRKEYAELLAAVLSKIDPQEPIALPVTARNVLLERCDNGVRSLVETRTA